MRKFTSILLIAMFVIGMFITEGCGRSYRRKRYYRRGDKNITITKKNNRKYTNTKKVIKSPR